MTALTGIRIGLAGAAAAGIAAIFAVAAVGSSANAAHVCRHLLNQTEALQATGETDIDTEAFTYDGSVLRCQYWASTEGNEGTHTLSLNFGTYRGFRQSPLFDGYEESICYVSQAGCKLAKKAQHTASDTRSFALLAQAMDHAGVVRRLHAFGGNPAIIWAMKHPPLQHITTAIVLHAHKGKALLDTCISHATRSSAGEADKECTLQSLRRAYHNLVIGR